MYDKEGNQIYNPEEAIRFYALPEKFMVTIVDAADESAITVYLSGEKNDLEKSNMVDKAEDQYKNHIESKKNSNKKSDKLDYIHSLVNDMI